MSTSAIASSFLLPGATRRSGASSFPVPRPPQRRVSCCLYGDSGRRLCGSLGLAYVGSRNLGFGIRAVSDGRGDHGGEEAPGREEEKAESVIAMQDRLPKQVARRQDLASSTGRDIAQKEQQVARNAAGDATTAPKQEDITSGKQSRAVSSGVKSIVTAPSAKIVKSSIPRTAGIVPSIEKGGESVPPPEKKPAPKSVVGPAIVDSQVPETKDPRVEDRSGPQIPPALTVQAPTVAEPAEMKADIGVTASDANSAEDKNRDSGPLAGVNAMNVIVVAAECFPWSKTGGLGDVVGALPKALARRGHRVMVVVPRYEDYPEAHFIGVRKYYKTAGQDMEVNYYHAYIDGVDFVFIDAPLFRNRQYDIYGGEKMEILKRMILFCKAAVEVPWHVPCGGACYGDGNLVFIANDWHTALLPVYLKAYYRDNGLMQYTRSVLVIHNIAHQGRGPLDEFSYMDLPPHYIEHFRLYDPLGGEHANIFAAGLKMADRVVTVSQAYSWELKTVEGGWGLHDIINHNDWKLHGIVNGIEKREWSPELDVHLQSDGYANYSLNTLETGKCQCKAALQRQLNLHVCDDVPVIGFIGRLDYQKGIDIIAEAMPWIVSQDVQLIMLGTGRADLEEMLRRFEWQHRDKVRGWVGFSVQMAHRITAGADILLMPSRFEPCGLNQLYAMMYGTIPVVHAVGGLRDTVVPFNPYNNSGLGWTFDRAEPNKLIDALGHCLNTYWNYKESWKGLQTRCMMQNLSWDHAAQLYEEVLVKAKYQW